MRSFGPKLRRFKLLSLEFERQKERRKDVVEVLSLTVRVKSSFVCRHTPTAEYCVVEFQSTPLWFLTQRKQFSL